MNNKRSKYNLDIASKVIIIITCALAASILAQLLINWFTHRDADSGLIRVVAVVNHKYDSSVDSDGDGISDKIIMCTDSRTGEKLFLEFNSPMAYDRLEIGETCEFVLKSYKGNLFSSHYVVELIQIFDVLDDDIETEYESGIEVE